MVWPKYYHTEKSRRRRKQKINTDNFKKGEWKHKTFIVKTDFQRMWGRVAAYLEASTIRGRWEQSGLSLSLDSPEFHLVEVLKTLSLSLDSPEKNLVEVLKTLSLSLDSPEYNLVEVLKTLSLSFDSPEIIWWEYWKHYLSRNSPENNVGGSTYK